MSQPIDDGGPAFPQDSTVQVVYGPNGDAAGHRVVDAKPGMSLRDWFAGQALTGMLADPYSGGDEHTIARGAYMQADAMLAARKRED